METSPEPHSDPIESAQATPGPFHDSLVPPDMQTFMVVLDGLQLDSAKVEEIEAKLHGIVVEALASQAHEVQPLDAQKLGFLPGGGLAGYQFIRRGDLIAELLPPAAD